MLFRSAGGRVLGGREAGIVGRQGSDDLIGGIRDDLELDARGGVSLAVVGLPAVVLAALGLGDLDIERDGVFLEVVLRLKVNGARIGTFSRMNFIGCLLYTSRCV